MLRLGSRFSFDRVLCAQAQRAPRRRRCSLPARLDLRLLDQAHEGRPSRQTIEGAKLWWARMPSMPMSTQREVPWLPSLTPSPHVHGSAAVEMHVSGRYRCVYQSRARQIVKKLRFE